MLPLTQLAAPDAYHGGGTVALFGQKKTEWRTAQLTIYPVYSESRLGFPEDILLYTWAMGFVTGSSSRNFWEVYFWVRYGAPLKGGASEKDQKNEAFVSTVECVTHPLPPTASAPLSVLFHVFLFCQGCLVVGRTRSYGLYGQTGYFQPPHVGGEAAVLGHHHGGGEARHFEMPRLGGGIS